MKNHNEDEWVYEEDTTKGRCECAIDVLTVLCMAVFLGWLFKDLF